MSGILAKTFHNPFLSKCLRVRKIVTQRDVFKLSSLKKLNSLTVTFKVWQPQIYHFLKYRSKVPWGCDEYSFTYYWFTLCTPAQSTSVACVYWECWYRCYENYIKTIYLPSVKKLIKNLYFCSKLFPWYLCLVMRPFECQQIRSKEGFFN